MTTKNREERQERQDNRPDPAPTNGGMILTEAMRALVTVLHDELHDETSELGRALVKTDRTDILVETVWDQLGREAG